MSTKRGDLLDDPLRKPLNFDLPVDDDDSDLGEELREIYKHRLKEMESAEVKRDSAQKHQLHSLQMYISELSEQNEILVQTVEELEREANERVALVESRLNKTNVSLQDATIRANDSDRRLEKMTRENDLINDDMKSLKEELSITQQQYAHLQTRAEDLEWDIDGLVEMIGTARASGKWEFAGLDLRTVPLDAILGAHAAASKHVNLSLDLLVVVLW